LTFFQKSENQSVAIFSLSEMIDKAFLGLDKAFFLLGNALLLRANTNKTHKN